MERRAFFGSVLAVVAAPFVAGGRALERFEPVNVFDPVNESRVGDMKMTINIDGEALHRLMVKSTRLVESTRLAR
jgi:hypothetical protein